MSLPPTIKAIAVPKHGDIDVIELVELPFPQQKPGDILVKVRRTAHMYAFAGGV